MAVSRKWVKNARLRGRNGSVLIWGNCGMVRRGGINAVRRVQGISEGGKGEYKKGVGGWILDFR